DREKKIVVGIPLTKDESPYAPPPPSPLPHGEGERGRSTVVERYDHIIIATGSRPFVPPIEGFGGPGTFLFRTLDDCARIADYAANCQRATVIGGGLLGLEAARGLLTHGVQVSVVEAAPHLMPVQLDDEGGRLLESTMEAMGITVLCRQIVKSIQKEHDKITGLIFHDGMTLATDMAVVSTGIRPIVEVANAAGLGVGRGLLTNDQMQTNDLAIFALGECVEHRGQIYGLVEPIWEMARTLADVITKTNPQAAYTGSKMATKLKVMGVELVAMGEVNPKDPEDEVITYREPKKGIYQKLIIRKQVLVGATLFGDTQASDILMQLFKEGSRVPKKRTDLLFGATNVSSLADVAGMPDHAQICNCHGISKGAIRDAIQTEGCTSVAKVGTCTKAGKGCGSCKGLIVQLIQAYAGQVAYDVSEHHYVPSIPLEKSQLIAAIKEKQLKSVSAVFRELGNGKEDAASKVGLASLLRTTWNEEYEDERDARFINDRVHANIQRDGTFSVVPRIYGGVTSADELIRIGTVAKKYNVPMVKITGGQRIDLLGIKKEDLPKIWKDLGMPSGHAYTKSVRTVKSCVGTDFCRYGVGDSIKLAQELEYKLQGIESPHKVKMAATGCPRNCAEAYVKDVGVVAIEGGKWEIYIGGAAGATVRKGDLLVTVETHAEVLKIVGRFLQYYREHAKYMERTYGFVERIGIDRLKALLIEDELGLCPKLDAEIEKAAAAYIDPWKEAEIPAYPQQFEGPELVRTLEEAINNG
ncbi:MAG TPA: nitrite reductase large subunit, partial [Deltaproteobacteria bacterium]|nr:nitrite reductase large subunit [Deltaproteobacteria bacterium]